MKTASLLALLLFTGCAAVAPGHDPVVVHAERTIAVSFDACDAFLRIEHAQREWYRIATPGLHDFAETLRADAPAAFTTARALLKAYKAARTPDHKANLDTALALTTQLATEATRWIAIAQSNPRKP